MKFRTLKSAKFYSSEIKRVYNIIIAYIVLILAVNGFHTKCGFTPTCFCKFMILTKVEHCEKQKSEESR